MSAVTTVWMLDATTRWDAALVGGKAASVARLSGVLDTRVPRSAVLPVETIRDWLGRALDAPSRRNLALAWAHGGNAPELRARLEHAGAPTAVMRALRGYFRHRPVLMVRSSAVMEDGHGASFAGHFESQATTAHALEDTLVHCAWAGIRAAFVYATSPRWSPQRRLEVALGSLALLVQAAVTSECAGVVFTRSPLHQDAMMVTAGYGSCHGVVDGTLPTDTYVVHPDTSTAELSYKEQMTVLAPDAANLWPGQRVATPLGEATFFSEYGPFLALTAVPKAYAGYPALGDDQLGDVCVAAAAVAKRLGHPVDMEWCFDEGDLTLLQARPVTAVARATAGPRREDAHGRPASPGVATGAARVLKDVSHVARARAGDVLVVTATDPAWLPAFYKAAAVVSEEGSPLSHTAIVARELGIPCLVGVEAATRGRFLDGELLTVDANEGLVHRVKRSKTRAPARTKAAAQGEGWCVDLRQVTAAGTRQVTVSALLDAWLRRHPVGAPRVEDVVELWRATRERCRSPKPVLVWDLAQDGLPVDGSLAALRAALVEG